MFILIGEHYFRYQSFNDNLTEFQKGSLVTRVRGEHMVTDWELKLPYSVDSLNVSTFSFTWLHITFFFIQKWVSACLIGSVGWANVSWFQLRLWFQGPGIKPCIGYGACLRISFSFSLPLPQAHVHLLSLSISLSKIIIKKKIKEISL